jgi:putative transposase
VLSSVPASAMSEVAEDLKAIFEIGHQRTAQALAADSVFEAGIEDALTYLHYPGNHHAKLRTTNMLERLFGEVKRRTRVVAVFPTRRVRAPWPRGDRALRSSAEWALRRYLTMVTLEALEQPNPQHSRH